MSGIDGLRKGEAAKITSLGDLSLAYRQRLYGLGLHVGAIVQLEHIAPLGCPIALRVGNSLLSLRKHEIATLLLEKL